MQQQSLKNAAAEKAPAPDFTQADRILAALQHESQLEQSDPVKQGKPKANPFPVEAFPQPIQKIIQATHQSLRYPVDFTGTAMLCAAATAIGNTHTAHVKNGWQESAVLYSVLVAPPGSNKSHPLSFAMEPINKLDDRSFSEYMQERKEYEMLQNMNKKQKDTAQEAEELQEPVLKKSLINDATLEALTVAHSHNMRGVCVYVDELNGFINNLNRYNGGSGGDVEFWLSAWSCKTVTVDRLTRKPVRIRRPFIPIIGTTQNKVLVKLGRNGKADNGFLDRFLFAMPQNAKKERWSDVTLDPVHTYNWEKYLSFLLDLKLEVDEWGAPIPRQLHFSPAAWLHLKQWQDDNTDLCNEAESESLKGVYTKLETYVIRLALVLQLMAWSCNETEKTAIELKAVEGAILLTEYFRRTAQVVNRIIHNEDPLDRYDVRKRELYERLPQSFTTAEGLIIAEHMEFPVRTFKSFLTEKVLFDKPMHGHYEKKL